MIKRSIGYVKSGLKIFGLFVAVIAVFLIIAVNTNSINRYLNTFNIRMTTQIYAPFQMIEDGKLTGSALTIVNCALDKMIILHRTDILLWSAAQLEVFNNNAAGFFAAAQTDERDAYAVASMPIAVQHISLVSLALSTKPAELSNDARIGSILGGGTQSILKKKKIKISYYVNSFEEMPPELINGRVDFFIVDSSVFDYVVNSLGFDPSQFKKTEIYSSYLRVYFGKKFLKDAPANFMDKFNDSLIACGDTYKKTD